MTRAAKVRGKVFVDSGAVIGWVNSADVHHVRVVEALELLDNEVFVTSDAVLLEALNYSGGRARGLRQQMHATVLRVMADSAWKVLPFGRLNFTDALERFASTALPRDVAPSLVDAHIHQVMLELGIDQILTVDHYFDQVGMTNLVKMPRRRKRRAT